MRNPKYLKELRNAKAWAQGAGRLIKEHLGRHGTIRFKGRINLVTKVDHAAERYVITRIHRTFAHDSILSEEAGKIAGSDGDRLWVLDPLDGTTNFAHQFPMFCVSIALVVERRPVVGVIHHPILNETFTAVRGYGAFLNGRRLRVTREQNLKSSMLATGFSYQMNQRLKTSLKTFGAFLKRSRAIRRAGSAALDLAYVACGRFDGFWERDLNPWDVAAGVLIVEESGGKISDFKGRSFRLDGNNLLATNARIHSGMLHILKSNAL